MPEDDKSAILEKITVQEAGRRGGASTRNRHGAKFYREIGAKGGESTKRLYGDLLRQFGKRGGRPRRPTLDEYMEEKEQ